MALALYGGIRFVKTDRRESSRERTILLNANRDLTDRLMHVQGVTWTPPPRPVKEPEETTTVEPDWVGV